MPYDLRPLELRAAWSTAYVNSLPDSSFLLVDGGNRYFPVKDANGKVDVAHLRNALARIPQASTLTADQRMAAMKKAKTMAAAHADMGSGPTPMYEGMAGSGRSRLPAEVMGLQTRSYTLDLEVRADGDGRTVIGRAVPYDQTAAIPAGLERFALGAFHRQIAAGSGAVGQVKLFPSHDAGVSGEVTRAVGKTTSLVEHADGLWGEWRMHDTGPGNDALALIRAGEVTGLSVGFKALAGGTRRGADGAYVRTGAHLDHVALTNTPVYPAAQVVAVRSRPAAGFRRDLLAARGILDSLLAGG
jgi:HK97 family phage prohead protease